jgi:serine/threonine protein phosphatase PrpC
MFTSKSSPLWATYLSILLVLGAAAADSPPDCPSYGCPLLPLDVVSDKGANAALTALRTFDVDEQGKEAPPSEETINEALQALISAGDGDKTTLTLCGDKGGPAINQDRAMIYSPYKIQGSTVKAQLLGVFDGHGEKGEITSEHAVTTVPKLLAQKLAAISLENEELVSQAIKETFIEVDKTDTTAGKGGCTATIVLQLGSKLYVGNAGDSRSMIAVLVEDDVEVVYESRDDKPDIPEEKARIIEMGGYVHIPDPKEDVPRAYAVAEDGRLKHGVAMSRSIGDWDCQGVIAEPIVDVLDIAALAATKLASYKEWCKKAEAEEKAKPDAEEVDMECDDVHTHDVSFFAISASDGLMDYVKPAGVAHVFAASMYVPENPHPHTASEYLILQAANMWNKVHNGEYRDDIAVAAFKVWSDADLALQKETGDDGEEL